MGTCACSKTIKESERLKYLSKLKVSATSDRWRWGGRRRELLKNGNVLVLILILVVATQELLCHRTLHTHTQTHTHIHTHTHTCTYTHHRKTGIFQKELGLLHIDPEE